MFPANAAPAGVYKLDEMQGHWHHHYVSDDGGSGASTRTAGGGNTVSAGDNTGVREPITDGVNGTPRTGKETAPMHTRVASVILI